jgi:hypothetical protein
VVARWPAASPSSSRITRWNRSTSKRCWEGYSAEPISATTEPTPAWCNFKQPKKPSTTITELLRRVWFHAAGGQIRMGAVHTAQGEAERRRHRSFFRNQLFSGDGRPRGNAVPGQLQGRLANSASFHGHHEVQHAAAGAARKAMKHVAGQVRMNGLPRDGSGKGRDIDRDRCGAEGHGIAAAPQPDRHSA